MSKFLLLLSLSCAIYGDEENYHPAVEQKSFWQRNKKTILITSVAAALIGAAVWLKNPIDNEKIVSYQEIECILVKTLSDNTKKTFPLMGINHHMEYEIKTSVDPQATFNTSEEITAAEQDKTEKIKTQIKKIFENDYPNHALYIHCQRSVPNEDKTFTVYPMVFLGGLSIENQRKLISTQIEIENNKYRSILNQNNADIMQFLASTTLPKSNQIELEITTNMSEAVCYAVLSNVKRSPNLGIDVIWAQSMRVDYFINPSNRNLLLSNNKIILDTKVLQYSTHETISESDKYLELLYTKEQIHSMYNYQSAECIVYLKLAAK